MADLISIQQFEDRTGRTLTAAQRAQASALIADASALAVDLINDSTITDTWDVNAVGTVPASVVPVVVAMVRRGLDNPHGFAQESTENYSYSGASGRGVFATRQETRVLRKAAGTSGIAALNLDSHLPGRGVNVWLDGAL